MTYTKEKYNLFPMNYPRYSTKYNSHQATFFKEIILRTVVLKIAFTFDMLMVYILEK